jgi:hypothetical protein
MIARFVNVRNLVEQRTHFCVKVSFNCFISIMCCNLSYLLLPRNLIRNILQVICTVFFCFLLLSTYVCRTFFHAGSDDAKAPNFPPHVYGSRAEAPPGAVGIYSKRKPSPPPASNDLCTIEEVTSSASVGITLSSNI